MTTLKKFTTVRPVYELTENGTSNILVPLLVVFFRDTMEFEVYIDLLPKKYSLS